MIGHAAGLHIIWRIKEWQISDMGPPKIAFGEAAVHTNLVTNGNERQNWVNK
jgi:hypothetical protein